MRCPFCGDMQNRVVDSRLSKNGNVIRRRRCCDSCDKRFTTYERIEEITPMVIKKDGRRETFDRMKLIGGLKKACEKRPIPYSSIENFVDNLEQTVVELGLKEVESSFIGEEVMKFLQSVDTVAYVRFASVYRSFKDIGEFMDELESLLKKD
ncbi:MAG: transcriptional repressor NrdR [Myxococcales bacterium]|nr:transcriptional repressor NrdR [Myxococcales bacterium]